MIRRCYGCMKEYDDEFEICPHCGYVHGSDAVEAYHLTPGTILQNKYIVGKVLGSGGFGVTYIGWDIDLERTIAINEYLPSEFATRMPEQTQVTVFSGDREEQFTSGMVKFTDEAKRLAKFHYANGIIHIYDSFEENHTAYIVMEHLDGESLKDYMERVGTLSVAEAIDIMLPILYALKDVHAEGIIHRDIAPDNIYLTNDIDDEGKRVVKLLDFGAARFATTKHSRSLSVLIKPGYSPEEQYRSRGDQGPWTDVYACAATMYKMITGITPTDSMERAVKDDVKPISKMGISISKGAENAILNAMNIKIENRTQSVEQFIAELENEQTARKKEKIKRTDVGKWPTWLKAVSGTGAAAVAAFGILLATGVIHFDVAGLGKSTLPEGHTRVPNIVNTLIADAETKMKEAELLYTIVGKEYSDIIAKDCILSQSLVPGNVTEVNSMIDIEVSGGPELAEVPSVVGYKEEVGTKIIKDAGFGLETKEVYNSVVSKGYICAQSEEAGKMIAHNAVITLDISLGRDPNEEFKEETVTIPNFVGMTYDEAITAAAKAKISLAVSDKKYSSSFAKDTVMEQSVAAGSQASNATPVELVISLGEHLISVPDVVYRTEDEAKRILSNAELSYSITTEESETVAAGLVISQSPADGERILAGSKVSLVISKGRGTFDMPNVVNKSEADAKSTLKGLGLSVQTSFAHSDSIQSGNVISQSLSAGTKVRAGTSVNIVISSGEELFDVVNVVGKSKADATSSLQANNFNVIENTTYDDNIAEGIVMSQSLTSGQYRKNTEIVITVSLGKMPVTVSFNGNGGNASQSSATVYVTSSYGELPSASRNGYIFLGWYTAASGGSKVTSGTTVNIRNNHTLYAQWELAAPTDWTTDTSFIGNSRYTVQTKTQYSSQTRTKSRDTKTISAAASSGTPQTPNGYTFLKKENNGYTNWSAWSGYAYTDNVNNTYTQSEGKTMYRYHMFECTGCRERCWSSRDYTCDICGKSFWESEWRELWLDYRYDQAVWHTWNSGKGYIVYEGEWWFFEYALDDLNCKTLYRRSTREDVYNYTYYKDIYSSWSAWSGWGDAVVTSNELTNVQTRTVYKYTLK